MRLVDWLIVFICVAILVFMLLSGCAQVSVEKQVDEKTVLKGTYTRWFNQKIGKFKLTSPDSWILEFENQESETELAFRLGVMSAQLGGGER